MLTLNQVNLISTGTEERHLKLQDCVFLKSLLLLLLLFDIKNPGQKLIDSELHRTPKLPLQPSPHVLLYSC